MQPKLNQIRLEMLKDISKFSRMDMQYNEQTDWSCLHGSKVKAKDLQKVISSWDLTVNLKLVHY